MSRLKVYYPLNEITNNLSTTGSQWMLETFEEYKGLYHTYTTGEAYSGRIYDKNTSKKLIPFKIESTITDKNTNTYSILKPKIKTKYNSIQPYIPTATSKDIEAGFITRYFLKKINNNTIIEINKDQSDDYDSKKIDPNLYNKTSFKWIITGPAITQIIGGFQQDSVSQQNKKLLIDANLNMPGLSLKLQNLQELYAGDVTQSTNILSTAPKDINNLDS